MIPKEKARELVNKYLQIYDGRVIEAKQCVLIAVNEIIDSLQIKNYAQAYNYEYWNEVKQEIENL